MAEARKNPMEEIVRKLDHADLVTLMQFMRMLVVGENSTRPPSSVKVELPLVDPKLDGPPKEKLRRTYGVGNNRRVFQIKRETRQCYNCGEIGHLKLACPKPPMKRDSGRREQSEDRGRGRRGGRGGYRANLLIAEKEVETGVVFTRGVQRAGQSFFNKI